MNRQPFDAIPVPFAEANLLLKSPDTWSSSKGGGSCGDLPVYSSKKSNYDKGEGYPRFASVWRFNLAQRLWLLFTGRIMLHVVGESHPPVGVSVNASLHFPTIERVKDAEGFEGLLIYWDSVRLREGYVGDYDLLPARTTKKRKARWYEKVWLRWLKRGE